MIILSFTHRIFQKIFQFFDYYFLCFANPVLYLQKRGVQIGTNCSILTDVKNFGSEPWLIKMGNSVTVTSGVRFITHDGSSRIFRKEIPNSCQYGNLFAPVILKNNCFIGANVILMPGVIVGENAIVGAGSVVTKNIDSDSVFAGVPAKKISSLDEYKKKYIEKSVPLTANNRKDLQKELTSYFWKKEC